MKKLMALLLAIMMVLSLSACGSDKQTDTNQTDGSTQNEETEGNISDNSTLEGIITGINGDFDSTIKKLTDELSTVYTTVGDSYDSYVENEQAIKDWYDLVQSEAESLFERTSEKAISYYKLVASTVDYDDSDALDDALDNFYDKVYEDAFDNFYDTIYEDSFDEIYYKYYDRIIDDAQDSVEYGVWLDVRSVAIVIGWMLDLIFIVLG